MNDSINIVLRHFSVKWPRLSRSVFLFIVDCVLLKNESNIPPLQNNQVHNDRLNMH